jgi:hypothetical protein
MDVTAFSQSPFSVVTLIVAPAMLTNATSVLAMSTINRMLRTRERMSELFAKSEGGGLSKSEAKRLVEQTNRVELQALYLLHAMRGIYVALGAFVAATLVTLLGAVLEQFHAAFWFYTFTTCGLIFGGVGVAGLIIGSVLLFRTTRLSLANIREEAACIRERQAQRTA